LNETVFKTLNYDQNNLKMN